MAASNCFPCSGNRLSRVEDGDEEEAVEGTNDSTPVVAVRAKRAKAEREEDLVMVIY